MPEAKPFLDANGVECVWVRKRDRGDGLGPGEPQRAIYASYQYALANGNEVCDPPGESEPPITVEPLPVKREDEPVNEPVTAGKGKKR